MPTKTKLSLLAAIGVAAFAFVALHRANERRFQALRQEVETIADEQRRNAVASGGETSRPPVVIWASAPPTAPSPPPGGERPVSTAPPTSGAEADAPTEADQAAHVGVTFSQESADPAWAPETERSIGASLRGLAETSTVEAVECRRSLCRASLKHLGQVQFSAFVDRVLAHSTEVWTGQVYSHRDALGDDGVVRNTIYFAKQGHSIPLLD